MIINYYCDKKIVSTITVDQEHKKVSVENYVDDIFYRPFRSNEHPTYQQFMRFMESRCIARTNGIVQQAIEEIGITEYDPIEICKRTHGRMHEDFFWMEFVEE